MQMFFINPVRKTTKTQFAQRQIKIFKKHLNIDLFVKNILE